MWICKKNVQQVKMAGSKTSQLFTGKDNVNFVLYLNIIFDGVDIFFIRSDIIRIWKYLHSDMELFVFLLGSPLVLNGITDRVLVDFCYFGVRVTRSLVLYVLFCRSLSVLLSFFFCPFSFVHSVVCPSIYGFWLHLWYLQTLLLR